VSKELFKAGKVYVISETSVQRVCYRMKDQNLQFCSRVTKSSEWSIWRDSVSNTKNLFTDNYDLRYNNYSFITPEDFVGDLLGSLGKL